MASELDLGGPWAPFWRDLGRSGRSFGHFWELFSRFFGVLNQLFFTHRSKMGSKRPFGAILERFWRVLRGLGWILGGFGQDFGRLGCGKNKKLPKVLKSFKNVYLHGI